MTAPKADAKINTEWECPCGQVNGTNLPFCSACNSARGNVPTELSDHVPVQFNKGKSKKHERQFTVTGQPINRMTGNVDGPTPPGHKSPQPVFASVPDFTKKEREQADEDEEMEEMEGEEFKQLRMPTTAQSYSTAPAAGDAVQRLMGLVRKHDNRKKSFDALFGGPESDYNNGIL